MTQDSEFRIYKYIDQVLKGLGWDTRNPSKGGDVYTQHEINQNPQLQASISPKVPESVVQVPHASSYVYWTIEAKADLKDIDVANREAKAYADMVNAKYPDAAKFATGIAGSPEDTFFVNTFFWDGTSWNEVEINDHKVTGFLSPAQCADLLHSNSHKTILFDDDPKKFLDQANQINRQLRNSAVPIGKRAETLGALLLAIAQDAEIDVSAGPVELVEEINLKIHHILRAHGKEEFADSITLNLPTKNRKKYRLGLVMTLQTLREMNVRSAMNSGGDALGKFYETFLKYANAAKDIGIVLTPRHLTRFIVEALEVDAVDRIFDPTCGTGGFLVSAIDRVKREVGSQNQFEKFKDDGIYGVENDAPLYALSIINMIFRGDGKSGIHEDDCFNYEFWIEGGTVRFSSPTEEKPDNLSELERPFTKVLMNPPFKTNRSEWEFVDYALRQMADGGLLAAILPARSIFGEIESDFRSQLLKRHSLRACIKLDKGVFAPVAQEGTYIVILEAHKPHNMSRHVLFSFLFDDEHRYKSKTVSEHELRDNYEEMLERTQDFLKGNTIDPVSLPKEYLVCSLNSDLKGGFAPEAYIENEIPLVACNPVDRIISMASASMTNRKFSQTVSPSEDILLKEFHLMDLVDEVVEPTVKALKELPKGNIPVVSATASNNGIAAFKNVPDTGLVRDLISISHTHNTQPCQAFWHPYDFAAIGTVFLIKPKPEFRNSEAAIYLCEAITSTNHWRYDYARNVVLDELVVFLPVDSNGKIDFEKIRKIYSLSSKGLFVDDDI